MVAAGIYSLQPADTEVLKNQKGRLHTREAAMQGFKHTPILPLVVWKKAQHSAGEK